MQGSVLIIRSASFQQMDNNLASIKTHFPDQELHILTHEHGSKLAGKYKDIMCVRTYPFRGPFNAKSSIPGSRFWNYSAVVVLVANLSGVGFDNVFRFAASLEARELYMCNLASEIQRLQMKDLVSFRLRDFFCRISKAILGTLVGIAAAALFALSLPIVRFTSPQDSPMSHRL